MFGIDSGDEAYSRSIVLPEGTKEVWVESFSAGDGAVTFRFHLNPRPEEIKSNWKRVEKEGE